MKTITVAIISVLFSIGASLDVIQAENNGTDIVVAENVIEAVNKIDIISLNVLLAEGATVDTVDEAGNSPLMLAARIGNPRMIEILLAHNPEINRRNNDGDTALMIASETGILPIVKALKNAGADPEMKTRNGLTSVQIAQRNGHGAVVQYFDSRNKVSYSL